MVYRESFEVLLAFPSDPYLTWDDFEAASALFIEAHTLQNIELSLFEGSRNPTSVAKQFLKPLEKLVPLLASKASSHKSLVDKAFKRLGSDKITLHNLRVNYALGNLTLLAYGVFKNGRVRRESQQQTPSGRFEIVAKLWAVLTTLLQKVKAFGVQLEKWRRALLKLLETMKQGLLRIFAAIKSLVNKVLRKNEGLTLTEKYDLHEVYLLLENENPTGETPSSPSVWQRFKKVISTLLKKAGGFLAKILRPVAKVIFVIALKIAYYVDKILSPLLTPVNKVLEFIREGLIDRVIRIVFKRLNLNPAGAGIFSTIIKTVWSLFAPQLILRYLFGFMGLPLGLLSVVQALNNVKSQAETLAAVNEFVNAAETLEKELNAAGFDDALENLDVEE